MLKKCVAVFLTLLFMGAGLSVSPARAGSFESLWEKSMTAMEKGLTLLASGKGKRDRGMMAAIVGRDPEYYRIVAKTFEVLSVSDVKEKMDDIVGMRKKIAGEYANIARYRKESIGAPSESMNPFTDTKDSLKKKIASAQHAIGEYEDSIESVKKAVADEIRAKNPAISQEQVDSLFLSIDGGDQVTILGMAENIRMMQEQIEKSLKSGDSNIETVKTYAGVFMMLNEAYAYAYTATIKNIQDVYLKKLDAIIHESQNLKQEAEGLMANAEGPQKDNLRANIASNAMTVTVGVKYRAYLATQMDHLQSIKQRIDNSVKVATNTYNTIRNSSQLLSLMNTSAADIKALLSFKMPEFAVLHDEALRREFSAITARLQLE